MSNLKQEEACQEEAYNYGNGMEFSFSKRRNVLFGGGKTPFDADSRASSSGGVNESKTQNGIVLESQSRGYYSGANIQKMVSESPEDEDQHSTTSQEEQTTGYFKTLVFLRFLAVTVLVAAALVLVALLLKASLLPGAIAGVVVGLSALAYNAIFGSAIAAGALAVASTVPLYLAHKKEEAGDFDCATFAPKTQNADAHSRKNGWRETGYRMFNQDDVDTRGNTEKETSKGSSMTLCYNPNQEND
jgi:hypothetical protein